jgi:hypothetical protein
MTFFRLGFLSTAHLLFLSGTLLLFSGHGVTAGELEGQDPGSISIGEDVPVLAARAEEKDARDGLPSSLAAEEQESSSNKAPRWNGFLDLFRGTDPDGNESAKDQGDISIAADAPDAVDSSPYNDPQDSSSYDPAAVHDASLRGTSSSSMMMDVAETDLTPPKRKLFLDDLLDVIGDVVDLSDGVGGVGGVGVLQPDYSGFISRLDGTLDALYNADSVAASNHEKYHPVFTFTHDSCLPYHAIGRDGSQTPPLPLSGNIIAGCRPIGGLLDAANTYHRWIRKGEWEVHMYELYFQKDQTSSLSEITGAAGDLTASFTGAAGDLAGEDTKVDINMEGHEHDFETAMVVVKNGQPMHVSASSHGKDHWKEWGDTTKHDGHPVIEYFHDVVAPTCAGNTHAFRHSGEETGCDSLVQVGAVPIFPTLASWFHMKSPTISNAAMRMLFSRYDYGSASAKIVDSKFYHTLGLSSKEYMGGIEFKDTTPNYERIDMMKQCPEGKELMDKAECELAGLSRGVGGVLRSYVLVEGTWDYTPCGCFISASFDQGIAFKDPSHGNCTADAAYPVVCAVEKPAYERIDIMKQCPEGKELVDKAECELAGLSRGVGGVLRSYALVEGTWDYTPCGCFISASFDQGIAFKDPSQGNCTADAKYPVVCKK